MGQLLPSAARALESTNAVLNAMGTLIHGRPGEHYAWNEVPREDVLGGGVGVPVLLHEFQDALFEFFFREEDAGEPQEEDE
ncbi:unnamed protein product, partial [Amoebophrya sp. A25]|eukprot:GSA25T00023596001.1